MVHACTDALICQFAANSPNIKHCSLCLGTSGIAWHLNLANLENYIDRAHCSYTIHALLLNVRVCVCVCG